MTDYTPEEDDFWWRITEDLRDRLGAPPQVEAALRHADSHGFHVGTGMDNHGYYASVCDLDNGVHADHADDVRVVLTLAGFTGPHREWDPLNDDWGPEFWTWEP